MGAFLTSASKKAHIPVPECAKWSLADHSTAMPTPASAAAPPIEPGRAMELVSGTPHEYTKSFHRSVSHMLRGV